jgi:hypothetical protein
MRFLSALPPGLDESSDPPTTTMLLGDINSFVIIRFRFKIITNITNYINKRRGFYLSLKKLTKYEILYS